MKPILARHILTLLGILALPISVAQATEAPATASNAQQYQQWIIDMKAAERGPFARIRWFCNDGRILPPKAYACGPQGGQQHGEWSAHTQQLRGDGYNIANLLAGIDAPVAIAQTGFNDSYNQILIEKFLIAADGRGCPTVSNAENSTKSIGLPWCFVLGCGRGANWPVMVR